MTIQDYAASAVEWPDPVVGDPHFVFLGDTVPIWAIQGPGFRSPYVMQPVTTEGIVTGVFPELGGFWIQEIDTDQDPLTSSGLFIYSGLTEPPVVSGDQVQISGIVRETSQQTQIFLAEPKNDIVVLSQGNPLPKAVELGPPPDQQESDRYYETIEGMLVQVSGTAQAVGPTSKYGEYVMVLSSHGVDRLWQGDETISGLAIMVDDGSAMSTRRQFNNDVRGRWRRSGQWGGWGRWLIPSAAIKLSRLCCPRSLPGLAAHRSSPRLAPPSSAL